MILVSRNISGTVYMYAGIRGGTKISGRRREHLLSPGDKMLPGDILSMSTFCRKCGQDLTFISAAR